jgi:hypothetical protein
MSNAFNLSQLANNVNSSGLLDASAGLRNAVPIANGGTGLTAIGSAGTVLTSDGTNASWGASTGSVANGTMYENSLVVTSNYTLSSGKNAMSVGPIAVAGGVTVTIPSGQRWIIF